MSKPKKEETFGHKLRRLREKEGLTIEELAAQVRMKPAYLARLEEDKVLPHVAEIITIARRLSADPSAFMGGQAPKAPPGSRRKAMATRTEDYAYQTLTENVAGVHIMAFRVTIEPKSDHRKVGYRHEGEEFIYVLSGKVRLTVSGRSNTLGPGQSIRFDSGKKHELKNPGSEPTVLLVVIYTP